MEIEREVYLQNNVDQAQWANRVNDLRLRTPFNNITHIKTALFFYSLNKIKVHVKYEPT